MKLESPGESGIEPRMTGKAAQPGREEVLAQLERIVQSIHFRNSKRYPTLLRFVVERTLEGNADNLKERTLGIEVFGRQPDYDTNADPVVRFTAGEIRKRIAQYYQMPEHEHELRFELPLGSYVPHFVLTPAAPAVIPVEEALAWPAEEHGAPMHEALSLATPTGEVWAPASAVLPPAELYTHARRRPLRLMLVAVLLLTILAAGVIGWSVQLHRRQEVGSSAFWQPLLATGGSCMVVMGVPSLDLDGKDTSPTSDASLPDKRQSMLASMLRSEMVPVSDVVSYGLVTGLLARNNHVCSTRSASETTFDQLRAQPVILIGGFDNIWTMRLTAGLRFRFAPDGQPVHEIVDSQNQQTRWMFDSAQSARSTSEDYSIVSEFFDPQIEQPVIVIAGIGKDGTEAAAEFVTNSGYLAQWLKRETNKHHHNYELVLSTQIIEGQHGPPHIVGSYSW